MRKMLALLLLLLSCGICSCAHETGQRSSPSAGMEEAKRSVDELTLIQPFNLGDYSKVVVTKLDTTTTPLPPRDDSTFAPTTLVLKTSTEMFASGIREQFKEAKLPIVVAEPDASSRTSKPGVLVVTGKVTKMEPGSRAKRYWVGFGAGKSIVEIAGDVVDGGSGKVLARFRHARASGIGVFGGDYQKFLSDDTREVGEDVGKMLLNFRSR
jgi:hypothetical protein